jgi:hypothetical protein
MSELKQPHTFPLYLKRQKESIYAKFFSQWEYCMLKIIKTPQGYHYAITRTECLRTHSVNLLEDFGMEPSTKEEYEAKVLEYATQVDNILKILKPQTP